MTDTQIMSEWITPVASAAGAVLAGVTAFVGAWFAPMRYRSQKWFDRKSDVYTKIFTSLNGLLEEYEALSEAREHGGDIVPEYLQKLRDTSRLCWETLREQSRIGSFIISPKSEEFLKNMLNTLKEDHYDYVDYLESHLSELQSAVQNMKKEARRDLRL